MVTTEQKATLTQTGPGTPLGELLRRSWLPFALTDDLTGSASVRQMTVLSQRLVLFRDRSGCTGLIQERCPHGGWPMASGAVDDSGIVCGRHGWRFDVEGNCSVIGYGGKVYPMAWARARTYPVLPYAGMYWTYLGPPPAPELPADDVLSRRDGRRRITVYPVCESDWFSAISRALCRGLSNGATPAHPMLLAAHEAAPALWLLVPIDDGHTWRACVEFLPAADGAAVPEEDVEIVRAERPLHTPVEGAGNIGADGRAQAFAERMLAEIERMR